MSRGPLLVLGARGFVGSAVVRAAQVAGWEVVPATSSPAPGRGWLGVDLRRPDAPAAALDAVRPRAVVNAAACLDDDPDAEMINADGPGALALACAERGTRLVHVSTDCVHGGREEPYADDAAPTPTGWTYARTKAAGEAAVTASGADAALVRPSVVLGPGSRHLHSDGTYFTDMLRQPVHVADLARLLVRLADDEVRGTLHAAGAGEVSRHQLARAVARSQGRDPDLVRAATLASTGLDRPAVLRLRTDVVRELGVRLRSVQEYLPPA